MLHSLEKKRDCSPFFRNLESNGLEAGNQTGAASLDVFDQGGTEERGLPAAHRIVGQIEGYGGDVGRESRSLEVFRAVEGMLHFPEVHSLGGAYLHHADNSQFVLAELREIVAPENMALDGANFDGVGNLGSVGSLGGLGSHGSGLRSLESLGGTGRNDREPRLGEFDLATLSGERCESGEEIGRQHDTAF